MLKSTLLFFAMATFVVVLLPIAGRNPQAASSASALAPAQNAAPAVPAKNPARPTAESQARAKVLYRRDCAFCHGDNGDGKNTMDVALEDWTNPSTLAGKTDSDLFATIRNGVGDKMPSEDAGRATDSEIWNLVIYIRSFSKNHPPAPPAPPAPVAPPVPAPADAPAPAPPPPTN
jgi:mono/diheme cytochrome c family protein